MGVASHWTWGHLGREIAALAPLAASGCILLALTVVGPWVNATFGDLGLVPLLIASGLGTVVATRIARTAPMREGLAIVLVLALAMRLSIVFIEPILSTDVYRYVWEENRERQQWPGFFGAPDCVVQAVFEQPLLERDVAIERRLAEIDRHLALR
jgi:hypothetical protein